jgi:putative ABC transport system permease protein
MAAGIVWGVASVFVLVAIGRGFESSQRASLEALGDSFLLLRVNRATTTRGDVRSNAFVRLDGEDMELMRAGAPSVGALSPKATNWFVQAFRGGNITRLTATGVDPEYADICHVALEPGGRWIDQNDLDQELPVVVLGWGAREELFGDAPCVGEEIRVIFSRDGGADTVFRSLTVIGALRDEELAGDDIYTSHRRIAFVPFTTWERFSPEDFQFFVMRPARPELKEQALAEVRGVLGRRHGFDGANRNTLVPYFDSYERRATIDAVFGGVQVFRVAVGVLILLLGAVGVANVVLMSVAARTYEFGLRRALGCRRRWIFAQVFLEAALVCVASGALGFLLGVLCVRSIGLLELPEGFAAPQPELATAWLPGALLFVVSLAAAAWPAARAARMSLVRALHGGSL